MSCPDEDFGKGRGARASTSTVRSFEAIKQHDLDAARTVMSAHLDRTARRVTQES
ncbi:hypothetical protein [Streptomyces sp. NPDC047009]|uniref:hypothetical protein n=1 Tax=unclassified Streptomyces TaxID=2593676 RepID=UPI0033CA86DE